MPLTGKISIIIVTLLWCMDSAARGFGLSWISHPHPDDTTQIWFRNTYKMDERPKRAFMTIATTGYFELYINERNVTGDVLTPLRDHHSANAIAITYDVTRFLRKGANTVAVWYAPSYAHVEWRQVAISLYGQMKDGTPLACDNDSNWLCRQANSTLNADGGETIDATPTATKWNADDFDVACWQPARIAETDFGQHVERRSDCYQATRIGSIRQQKHFDIEGDSVTYDFGEPFVGLVRVTLRGTTKGQHISVGNIEYTCRGESDEQIIQRFTLTNCRRLLIRGDENFDREQIQKVEALETTTYTRNMRE